ncbi:non-ribosomal peptide synthetase [Streptomyces apocyni]|uniref:non-ribosomal peptide synthetase n=1 Tax=Streptomyces apocyni TaxID=2654677 RepID=UPI0018D12789|nr:non-ribosomal peptide synthetase [Streptomyces apocyni]
MSEQGAARPDLGREAERPAPEPDVSASVAGWAAEVKRYAAERLPGYLVPDVVVSLDSLPMTANGKADRAALPTAVLSGQAAGRAPQTVTETELCALFAEVLRVPQTSATSDFFECGGNSLLAMRLVSRVRARMGYQITVRDVFDASTAERLAALLSVRSAPGPALTRRPTAGPVPLAPVQRRLWFVNRLEGGGATYNIPIPLRLRGPLDRAALWAALETLVERHESLRTIFPETDGEPHQVVLDTAQACPRPDVIEIARDELAVSQAAFERQGFDLRTDPPLRARLFALGDEEHLLLLVVHHIACDGWSMEPLANDLAAAYAAHHEGRDVGLPPLAVHYTDFARWQHEVLGTAEDPDSVMSRQLAFWTEALSGLPDQLELPLDRPRPARESNRGATVDFTIPPDLTRAIERLAAESGASTFMVVQAALAAVLNRLGAGDDIPIGTPAAGRSDEALDDVVGFFANTLVLRTDTSGDVSFTELLGRVREFTFQALAHQELPFDVLVEALNPHRSTARHSLFQVMLVFENNAAARLRLPGLDVTPQPSQLGVSRFDLVVSVTPPSADRGNGQGMECFVEYASDLFDRASAERIAGYLVTMLEQVTADPDAPVSAAEIRSDAERQAVDGWNATGHDVRLATLPALFEEQVARTPDRCAVVHEGESLTFRELNSRANRFARYLVRCGAGPERVVALALPRSLEMIVAFWAVLKSGAAYLPVDLDYPEARIEAMLDDARPPLVLTTTAVSGRLPLGSVRVRVDEEELVTRLAAESDENLTDPERLAPLHPEHPLYVIYTSGSTGRPKGVVMPGAPLVNLLAWHATYMPAEDDSVTAQFASTSFDPAAQEILSAGTSGKTLAVPTDAVRRSPADLARWLEREQVTELFAPTALIEMLCVQALRLGLSLPRLRHVAQGGEALVLTGPVREFFDAVPGRRLHNYYGPTETHAATGRTVPGPFSAQPGDVPIGRPVWNTRVHLLDPNLRPVPRGVAGEAYIAGACLARGYLDRPDETARRFLPDPFGEPGSRMYRTGDLARWNAEGELEFLGRDDFQVKIRGFRIELGEVEAALRDLHGVARAVVTVRSGEGAGPRLAAYVVPAEGAAVDPAEVKAAVGLRLPGYMIPSAVMVLASLPMTPNGKVDRLALPAPAASDEPVTGEPSTDLEKQLCALVARVLGVRAVGVSDDFFVRGGHSLLVTRLIDMVSAELELEMPVRAFFDEPTVEGMVRRLVPVSSPRPALRPRRDRPAAS